MSNTPAIQKARKKMHLARLEAKKGKNYTAYYAGQPEQVERAKQNEKFLEARRNLVKANEALEIATITGEGLEDAKKEQAVAALVVERTKPVRGGAVANLQGA